MQKSVSSNRIQNCVVTISHHALGNWVAAANMFAEAATMDAAGCVATIDVFDAAAAAVAAAVANAALAVHLVGWLIAIGRLRLRLLCFVSD